MSGVVARLEEQAEEAARQAERLRKMVELARELGDDGLSELVALIRSEDRPNGHKRHTTKSTPSAPVGREAVRRIVRKRPGIWTYAQLREAMQREGWFTTDTGLGAAVTRLCDVNREGRRIGKGRYLFPADHEGGLDDESDASGVAGITSPLM